MKCSYCNKELDTSSRQMRSRIGRAMRAGLRLFCDKKCSGLGRRLEIQPTLEQKKEAKRIYDAKYREKNLALLKEKKHKRFKVEYAENPEKFREQLQRRMPYHVEYCRQPEYAAKKLLYDKQCREAEYGDFAENWRLLLELEQEIRNRSTSYERRVMNGYYTRAAQRLRSERWQTRKALRQSI